MKIIQKIKNEFLYAGLSKEEFLQVKEPVGERNRRSIITWSSILGLFWFASLLIYRTPEYADGRMVLFVSLIIVLVFLACALFLIKRFNRLLFPTMYLLELSVLGTGIGLAFVQPDQRTATMIAIALMIPVFYIDRTIVTIALEASAIADVYDALVSKRVYKERYSFEEADRIILDGMGTQFDPALRKYYEAARPKLEAYYASDPSNG